ncbi:MAG: hypothetical protein AB1513_11405 [Pseudomonadota bacterium]
MIRYLLNFLIWIDIGINVLLFSGSPYETLSSRIGRRAERGERWACVLCKLLDRFDRRHCEKSRVEDYGKTSQWWQVINPLALALLAWLIWSGAVDKAIAAAMPSQLTETRYVQQVARDTSGRIKRSVAVVRAFAAAHPCPSSGWLDHPGCPGWAIQHDIALACGGADAVSNMSWMKDEYKTGYAILPSGRVAHMGYIDDTGMFVDMMRFAPDRVERLIGARVGVPVPGSSCLSVVIQ